MNDFSARITLRRLCQTYTGLKKPEDYGYSELVTSIRNRIAVSVVEDSANEEFYNKRFDSYVKLCNSSRDVEYDLLENDLIDHLEDETLKAGCSVEQAFLTYTYVMCKRLRFLPMNKNEF